MLRRRRGEVRRIDADPASETVVAAAVLAVVIDLACMFFRLLGLHTVAWLLRHAGTLCGLGIIDAGLQVAQLHLRAHSPSQAGEQRQPEHQEHAEKFFHHGKIAQGTN